MHDRKRPRVCLSRRTADGSGWLFSFREAVGANPERTEFFRIEERETVGDEKAEESDEENDDAEEEER
jgi:hypothetical protein